MDTQELMNAVYDVIAQNPISSLDHNTLTGLVDHVDTDRNAIVFINHKGKEFELRLVDNYAPSPEAAQ